MFDYLPPLLSACGMAAVGTVIVRATALRFNLVVAPREDRWHVKPTALYGGVAIAIAAWAALISRRAELFAHPAAGAILGATAVLFVVGLIDDARGMGPVGKFILQLIAGSVLIVSGVVYPLTPWNPVNVLVTLFWFVGIVNALNLLDNMDGVTAGVAAVAAAAFAAFFAEAGDLVLMALSLATAGAAAGFLFFNFKPASIFMGDVGSLFLGGMLAGLGAAYPIAGGTHGSVALVVPALVLMIPILDTVLVTVSRTLHNRPISIGGRDHLTHRLVAMGFSESRAALLLYAFGVAAFAVASTVKSMAPDAGIWLGLVFFTAALVFAGYLGRLHRYDDEVIHERRRRGVLLRNILLKRRGLELLLDVVLFGVAYYGAFVIYYDGVIPESIAAIANGTLATVIVLKLSAFHYFKVYRGIWNRTGLADVHRIVKATLLGGMLVIAVLFIAARGASIPRTVFVLDLLITGALAVGARSSFGSLDRFRERLRSSDGDRALIYGAGPEADLVLKALDLREGNTIHPVGFIDDQEGEGTLIHGLPVLGSSGRLQEVLSSCGARYVIVATLPTNGTVPKELRNVCRDTGVELLSMTLSLRPIGVAASDPVELQPVNISRSRAKPAADLKTG